MLKLSRTTALYLAAAALLLPTACSSSNGRPQQQASRDTQAPPAETHPEWAADQPEYMKPVADLEPQPPARSTDPLHYFTNERTVMVRKPGGYQEDEIPRVALYATSDNGFHWSKQGYFGRGQSFFAMETPTDGDYGIRFVGPGQESEDVVPAEPVRVYHVDTCEPAVEVWVEPEQTWYNIGDTITISWRAADPHLIQFPVSISMLLDFSAGEGRAIELQRDLANEGSLTYVIPDEAFDHEAWFRVAAKDRAGNLGVGYSFALQVVDTQLAEREEQAAETRTSVSAEPVTSDEARQLFSRAADEYDALLATLVTKFREASAAQAAIAQPDTNETAEAPTFGRNDADDSPSENSTNLPFATIVSREVVDSTGDTNSDTTTIASTDTADDSPIATHLTSYDPTQGNGLMVPLPATLDSSSHHHAIAHPWRALGARRVASLDTDDIWSLARRRTSFGWEVEFEGRFLADNPALRNVAAPATFAPTYAGTGRDDEGEPKSTRP